MLDQDLNALLDEIEELLDDAPHIPLTSKIVVDMDRLYGLVDRLRKAIPEGIQQAQRVVRDRERILAQAREEADAIIKDARARAEKLTSESVITQRAEEEAARILEEARRQSREIKLGAREYAATVLERLEGNIQKCASVVRQALDEMGVPHSLPDEEPAPEPRRPG